MGLMTRPGTQGLSSVEKLPPNTVNARESLRTLGIHAILHNLHDGLSHVSTGMWNNGSKSTDLWKRDVRAPA